MSEMIERAAGAIAAALVKAADGSSYDLSHRGGSVFGYIDFGEFDVQVLARAAIEAMREPTEAVLDVLAPAMDYTRSGARSAARQVWSELIDVLKEP